MERSKVHPDTRPVFYPLIIGFLFTSKVSADACGAPVMSEYVGLKDPSLLSKGTASYG